MFKKIFGIKDKKEEKTIEEVKIQESDQGSEPIEKEISQGYIHEPVIAQAEIEKPQIHEPVMGEAEIAKPQIHEPVTGEAKIQEPEKKRGFFERLKDGLLKTRNAMSSSIDNLINGKAKIDDDLYDELEEILISADMGVDSTVMMIEKLRDTIEEKHIRDPKFIKEELVTIMKAHLLENNINNDLNIEVGKQTVILVIGVNGVGKTTTIGKLAKKLENDGLSVMLAAADTFRAAAIEQLTEWANRAGVDIVSHSEGADPASVVFDAISSQKAKNKDVLIIDTAGRLHNKKNLMNELEKINRIIDREHPGANREALLVLDATTGQNAVYQAKEFSKVTGISGIVLTKLDGTAKGGVVFPLQADHKIPVKYIGIGEGIDNLEKFEAEKFVDAIMNIG